MRSFGILLVSTIVLASAAGAAVPPPGPGENGDPPKTVLVLAGGGARGMAHIGVLEVLEELRIPVDVIIGTSMGSVVGGMYASGLSPAEMRAELESIDWADAFDDAPARKRLPFRRKEEDNVGLAKIEAGFNKENGFSLPGGLVAGQKLNFILRSMLVHTLPVTSFDDLAIPFRAIAADLDSGEMVVISDGDLPQAIRASMAFPVLFTPVRYDGKLLIDGGVVRNMAVDVALEMGAERIIAVDVGSKLGEMKKANLAAQKVLRRTQSIMSKQTRAEQLELIRPQDLLLEPVLDGVVSFADFEEVGPAIRAGVEAARRDADRLRQWSVPEAQFDAYLARHREGSGSSRIEIVDIEVRGVNRVAPERILRRIKTRPGKQIDLELIRKDLEEVYLIGEFESVDFDVEPEGSGYRLIIQVDEKSWGPWYVRAGLALSSNFKGIGDFTLNGILRRAELNRFGAEWRTVITVGSIDGIWSEFYQPLSYAGTWFFAPRVQYYRDGDERRYFQDGELLIDSRNSVGAVDVGYMLGQWGQLRLGVGAGKSANRPTAATEPNIDRDLGFLEVKFQVDRLDDFFFPKHGQQISVDGRWNRETLGADDEYDRLEIRFDQAFTRRRDTVLIGVQVGADFDTQVPFYDDFALGGFLRLSGLKQNALRGDRYGFGRLVYFRRLSKDFSFLGTQSYVGASVELGNAFQPGQPARWDELLPAGSIFVGVDTLLGPLYLSYGRTSTYSGTWYLLFGRAL